ncbi:MAG: peptidoglycan DD-metalloendopeptidase family protein [Chloroflexota bacterium]
MLKHKFLSRAVLLLVFLAGFLPSKVHALTLPPVDMFQLPWERGLAWIAMDGIDNGTKRLSSSPHNYKMGGAVDFAPHVGMKIGEDTSNAWVTAAASGTVIEVSSCHIKISHANGWTSEYYHLGNIQVQVGQVVAQNQRLAIIDNNALGQVCVGNLWPGPHLHFTIRPNIVGATLAGWLIKYDVKKNKTTFNKNGQSLGSFQPILNAFDTQIVQRELLAWDTLYTGNVDAYRYERWSLQLTESSAFTVTVNPTSGDLSPLLILMDANGSEITRATGVLTSTQPAGNYFVQVQPQHGSGSYSIILTRPLSNELSTSIIIEPSTINVGETALVSVRLNNVPASGLTSAEFTCSVDPALLEISNITIADLFGPDPASAINGPQSGNFIVAIAGSRGNRATTDGVAFTFYVKGLMAGQAVIDCQTRVSSGDNQLTAIPSIPSTLVINGTSLGTSPVVNGRVIAYKPATVNLFEGATLVNSVPVNADGTFNFTTVAGNYTVVASAEGYLTAQGTISLADGSILTLSTVTLPAGDIDGNSVIDQFDAMTIGMSYNTALPSAADLNNDGVINVLDLELLAAYYRQSGALVWS